MTQMNRLSQAFNVYNGALNSVAAGGFRYNTGALSSVEVGKHYSLMLCVAALVPTYVYYICKIY
jgi:hypothetical protein